MLFPGRKWLLLHLWVVPSRIILKKIIWNKWLCSESCRNIKDDSSWFRPLLSFLLQRSLVSKIQDLKPTYPQLKSCALFFSWSSEERRDTRLDLSCHGWLFSMWNCRQNQNLLALVASCVVHSYINIIGAGVGWVDWSHSPGANRTLS